MLMWWMNPAIVQVKISDQPGLKVARFRVNPAPVAIHADPDFGGVEHVDPRFSGELRAFRC
jgi:hypothetical protein